jgi:hypothetical protein
MTLKIEDTKLDIFGSDNNSSSEKPRLKILYFTSSGCLEKPQTEGEWQQLLNCTIQAKKEFDSEIKIYFINSENERLDRSSVEKIRRKDIGQIIPVEPNSEILNEIKKDLSSRLKRNITSLQCGQVILYLDYKNKTSLVHNGGITFSKNLHGLLNDLILHQLHKESKNNSYIFTFERFCEEVGTKKPHLSQDRALWKVDKNLSNPSAFDHPD